MIKNLKELAKIATPIDPSTMRIETFKQIIEDNDEYLQEEFVKLVDDEFCGQIQNKGIHFILNRDKNKMSFMRRNEERPMLKIEYCGMDELPTIVISNL